jgi:hypothetical protein
MFPPEKPPGGAYIGFYVCASLSPTWKKGAYMQSDVCATREGVGSQFEKVYGGGKIYTASFRK